MSGLSDEDAYAAYRAYRRQDLEFKRVVLEGFRYHAFIIARLLGAKVTNPTQMGKFSFEPHARRHRNPAREKKRKEFSKNVRAWALREGLIKDEDGQDVS